MVPWRFASIVMYGWKYIHRIGHYQRIGGLFILTITHPYVFYNSEHKCKTDPHIYKHMSMLAYLQAYLSMYRTEAMTQWNKNLKIFGTPFYENILFLYTYMGQSTSYLIQIIGLLYKKYLKCTVKRTSKHHFNGSLLIRKTACLKISTAYLHSKCLDFTYKHMLYM